MDPVVYLAGYPKSGTTWMRALLSAYLTGRLDTINVLLGTRADTAQYPFFHVSPKPTTDLDLREWAHLCSAATMNLVAQVDERPLFLKTHHSRLMAYGTSQIAPVAEKAIYIVRDPRDIAPSFAKHLGISVDDAIDQMIDETGVLFDDVKPPQFTSSWDQHVLSWLKSPDMKVVMIRYEDLWNDTEKVFGNLMKALGDNPPDEKISGVVELADINRLRNQEEKDGFVEASRHTKFFGKGGSRWRETLTADQAAKIENAFHGVMDKLGYEVERQAA